MRRRDTRGRHNTEWSIATQPCYSYEPPHVWYQKWDVRPSTPGIEGEHAALDDWPLKMTVSGEESCRLRGRRQDDCVGRGVVYVGYVGDAKMTVSGEESCRLRGRRQDDCVGRGLCT